MSPFHTRISKCAQRGSVMLEALIAVMIFAIGILGTIGLQAKIIGLSTDARYRTDATFLANQIIAQIWVDPTVDPDDPSGYTLNVNSTYACATCDASNGNANTQYWVTQTHGASGVLPPYGDFVTCPSSIAMNGNQVTVTVQWQLPQEAGNTCHSYSSMTEIQYN